MDDVQQMSKRCPQNVLRLPVPIWLTQNQFEHPKDMQKMSSKGSSTSSYLTYTTPVWTPHGRPNDVLKGILYKFLFECPNPIWTPHGRATRCSKPIRTPPAKCPQIDRLPVLFECPNPIWTPHGRAKYALKVIVYQFLFDWHNICLNTPWTPKRCPQNVRLPVPIWLTQNQFEHPKDMQKMFSKGSSTSSYLTDTTPVWTPHGRPNDASNGSSTSSNLGVPNLWEHPMDVQMMSSNWSSASPIWVSQPYLNTAWTCKRCPQSGRLPVPIWLTQNQFERPKDMQMMSSNWSSASPIWVSQPYLNTAWTCKRCPQSGRLPVPIWLTQNQFEHHMDVQMMSSKWSSTSSYLSVPTLFEHPLDVQKMSSKWSYTSSYLTDTTSVWPPHGRPNDVLKGIPYKFLFECPNPIWTPHRRATDVLKLIVYQLLFDWHNTCLNTPWTSKRCPQNDRLPVPIWLTQNQFEHPKDMQKMSSKGSSTSSYLTYTTPVWTPHGRPNDVLKGIPYKFLFECPNPIWTPHRRATDVLKVIVYQFLFDWHNICLNTPWTSKRCPQNVRLLVPIWLTQNQLEHPKDMQMMSSNWSSASPIWVSQPYLNTAWTCKRCPQSDRLPVPIWLTQNQFEHHMDVQKMSSKWSSTCSYLTDTTYV